MNIRALQKMPAYVLLFLELLVSSIYCTDEGETAVWSYPQTGIFAEILIKMHFSKAFFILVIKTKVIDATVVH